MDRLINIIWAISCISLIPQIGFAQVGTPTLVTPSKLRDGGTNFPVKIEGEAQITPAPYNGTLFGHQRTANPYTLGDIINNYGIDGEVWEHDGGTVTGKPFQASIDLDSTTSSAYLETHRKFRYQAARQQTILQTVALQNDAGVSRWGNFCYHDGLYWQADAGSLSTCRRTSAEFTDGGFVDYCEAIPSAALPTGFNPYMGNIYEIRFAWLGVHEVDWWINGKRVNQDVFDSVLPYPYMSTATLPLRAESHSGSKLRYICSNVTSEGGGIPPTPGFSYSRPATKLVAAGAGILPIIAIRPSVTVTLNGAGPVHSHMEVIPASISCQVDGDATKVRIYSYLNPTITDATWAIVPTSSGVEVDIAATATSGGIQVCTYGADEGTHELHHVFGINQRALRLRGLSGPGDVLMVAADSISGNHNVTCSIEWQEVR